MCNQRSASPPQSSFQAKSHVGGDCRLTAVDAMELLTRDAQDGGRERGEGDAPFHPANGPLHNG